MRKRSTILFVSYCLVTLLLPLLLKDIVPGKFLFVGTAVILFVLAIALYKDHLIAEFRRFQQQTSLGAFLLKCAGYYLLIYVLRLLTFIVLNLFIDMEKIGQNQLALNELTASMPVIVMFFMISIYAPVVEELVFRQAILGAVDQSKRVQVIVRTGLSIGLFTLIHVLHWADILLYLPVASVLTWVYWKYDRNIIASIGFHFVNNTLAFILMLVMLAFS